MLQTLPTMPALATESPEDEELINRAKTGDERAWEEIFNNHYAAIFRFLRARVAGAEQAEDLAANVFMQAFRSIDRFAWQGRPFAAWLFGIARHELAAYYRSRQVVGQLDKQHEPAASDQFLSIEIDDILVRLPAEHREALELRFVIGLTGIEAAAAMGRSHGSFRSLLFRACRAFRTESNRATASFIPLSKKSCPARYNEPSSDFPPAGDVGSRVSPPSFASGENIIIDHGGRAGTLTAPSGRE